MSNPSQSSDLRAGSVLGRYELLLPIAKGGMAQVWAARLRGSRGFQKLVAIKTILPDVIDSTRMERMFLEEAQLASQIHHPNVVGTLELGEQDGTLYLVMDWVDGEPLNQVMTKASAQGGLPLAIAVNLIGQACKGLYAAHELRDDNGELMGLVHRDVSPQNLLVSFSGTAKLVDFGIAKATARSSGLTEAGEVKGKFSFMAPEQVRGQIVDCRTDLFALGIVLYALTTGKHPFRGENPAQTLQNICSERAAPAPSTFISDYPAGLEAVVLKALAKTPADRFDNANEMLAALEEAMPEPLEASFEVQVAKYLQGLFGDRAAERRAAIRGAQEQADRQRADASASSVGTLRAISIDRQDSDRFVLEGPATPAAAHPHPTPPWSSKRKLLAAGSFLGIATMILVLRLGGEHAPIASASATSPVPPEAPLHAASVKTVAATPEAPPTTLQEPAAAPSAEIPEQHKGRVRRAAAPSLPTPKPGPVAAQPVPAQPAAPPSSSPSPMPPSPAANAWDRGAFGGRH